VQSVSAPGDEQKMDKALIRAAGEHAVVSELSRRGALAALVAEGARGVDVLASKGRERVTIQVKTRQSQSGSWPLQNLSEDADFTVLVVFGNPNDYWIIQTRELMAWSQEGHERWVRTPGRGGRPHNPNSPNMPRMSLVAESFAHTHNAWDRLWGSP
jgi:hypothetical protein